MTLSHELLAEFVTCLRQESRGGFEHERRVLPRFKVWCALPVTRLDADGRPGQPFTVHTRDLSRGGLGLMATRCLPLGQRFLVALPTLTGGPQWFVCNVVYCAGSAEELFSVGAAFTQRWDPAAQRPIPLPAGGATRA